jgi:hypothetical protein
MEKLRSTAILAAGPQKPLPNPPHKGEGVTAPAAVSPFQTGLFAPRLRRTRLTLPLVGRVERSEGRGFAAGPEKPFSTKGERGSVSASPTRKACP